MSGFKPDTPVSVNPGQFPRPVSQNPPSSQTSQGPPLRTSLKAPVPGRGDGTPMDKAPTVCP